MRTGRISKLVKSRVYRHLGGNVIGGDPSGLEYDWAAWLVQSFDIDTVLDVGSGEGHMVEFFQQLDCQAIGLDGLPRNGEVSPVPTVVWDLTKGPLRIDKIDLVWCVELVEHVAEEHIENVLKTIANGEIICMSHAGPRDAGWHHVNCQPAEYWTEKIEAMGYNRMRKTEETMREITHGYLRDRGLLFKRCSQ